MTLSNIFFGKKVVQQAYLNNALIYQSNGWQTLPSICTEVWTKNYAKVSNMGAVVKDDQDNIYIGADQFLIKMNSEGKIIWKTDTFSGKNIVQGNIKTIILGKTYIYISESYSILENGNNNWFYYLAKIDKDGFLVNNVAIDNAIPKTSNGIKMVADKTNVYGFSNGNVYKFDLNMNLINYVNIGTFSANDLATNNDGPYLFISGVDPTVGYKIIRIFKNDFSKNAVYAPEVSYVGINILKMDTIGNVYMASDRNNLVFKYNAYNGKLITQLILGSGAKCFDISLDFQENVYIGYTNNNNGTNYLLRKYSSDGTLIWDNVPIPASNNNIKIITDSNGNIYVAYIDSSSMLAIKKLINIEKKGS